MEWCVSVRRLGFVCCGFVGRRLRGNGERLCGCKKSHVMGESNGGVVGIFLGGERGSESCGEGHLS